MVFSKLKLEMINVIGLICKMDICIGIQSSKKGSKGAEPFWLNLSKGLCLQNKVMVWMGEGCRCSVHLIFVLKYIRQMLFSNNGLAWHQGLFVTVTKVASMWFFEGICYPTQQNRHRLHILYKIHIHRIFSYLWNFCSVVVQSII